MLVMRVGRVFVVGMAMRMTGGIFNKLREEIIGNSSEIGDKKGGNVLTTMDGTRLLRKLKESIGRSHGQETTASLGASAKSEEFVVFWIPVDRSAVVFWSLWIKFE